MGCHSDFIGAMRSDVGEAIIMMGSTSKVNTPLKIYSFRKTFFLNKI